MSNSNRSSSKKTEPASPADELINEFIQKRRLQQDALMKIMTSIDATDRKVKAVAPRKRKSKK